MKNKINLNFIKVNLEDNSIIEDKRENYTLSEFQIISKILNNKKIKYKNFTFFKIDEFQLLNEKEKSNSSNLYLIKKRMVKEFKIKDPSIYIFE